MCLLTWEISCLIASSVRVLRRIPQTTWFIQTPTVHQKEIPKATLALWEARLKAQPEIHHRTLQGGYNAKNYKSIKRWCLLYISTSVWVLRTPNAGPNSHFQRFLLQKAKKSKKFAANFCKKQVFLSLHQNAGRLFYSQKNSKQRGEHGYSISIADDFVLFIITDMKYCLCSF